MKVFKKKQAEESTKRWAITLIEEVEYAKLIAVDSYNGKQIAVIMVFMANGEIVTSQYAKDILIEQGYSPAQYNNKWDDKGRIIIKFHC